MVLGLIACGDSRWRDCLFDVAALNDDVYVGRLGGGAGTMRVYVISRNNLLRYYHVIATHHTYASFLFMIL